MARRKGRAQQDTYNYKLKGVFRETVYHGITNDPDRRFKEHERDGKIFYDTEVSRARSRGRAENDETEAIHRHQDNDVLGSPPQYNKAKIKKPDPDPLGLFGSPPKKRSRINFVVCDSAWEAAEAFRLEHCDDVVAWAKNDHLVFEVIYLFNGVVRKYRPDFIIRLRDGKFLVLEVKGQETFQDKVKRDALEEWVKAVNQDGSFGTWLSAVSKNPADVEGIIKEAINGK